MFVSLNNMPYIQFQLRRGTAAEWIAGNPLLAQGEIGIELPDNPNSAFSQYHFKIGDGIRYWSGTGPAFSNPLPYASMVGPTGATGATYTPTRLQLLTIIGPTGP